ncbi:hypothetical protein C8R43DRAFT_1133773 [Mycena crocata]|nr:hypothetical protein C8R43DRAFT_1133773 [Mycena crocata]
MQLLDSGNMMVAAAAGGAAAAATAAAVHELTITQPSIFATRQRDLVAAIAAAMLLYDHILTWVEEVTCIWNNPAAGAGNRIGFMVNRYITEAMVIYVAYMLSGGSEGLTDKDFIWLFAIASTVFVALSHFIIMARVYTLWDRRKMIKWILMGSFGVAISISMAFSILSAHEVQPFLEYNPVIHMCTFAKKPWSLPFMLGALTVFDLFIIALTVWNALDRPHQKQADVMTALQRDGAMMFVGLFRKSHCSKSLLYCSHEFFLPVLRVVSLMMAIFGDPSNCFVTLSFVWSLCSMVNSRIQLRVEGLRFIRHTVQPGDDIDEYALHDFNLDRR